MKLYHWSAIVAFCSFATAVAWADEYAAFSDLQARLPNWEIDP